MPASPAEAKDSARPRVRDEKRCKESLVQRSEKIQATKQAANKKIKTPTNNKKNTVSIRIGPFTFDDFHLS